MRLHLIIAPLLAAAAIAAMGAAPPAVAPEDALGLGGGLSLEPAQVATHLGQRIVVYRLRYRGLPVFLSTAAVQFGADGAIRRMSARVPEPPVEGTGARDEAAERLAASARAQADGLEVRDAASGWLRGGDGRLVPVIRVEAEGGWLLDEPMAVFYGVKSLAVLGAEPLFETATAGGLVFAENPVTTPDPVAVELAELDEPGDLLYGAHARVGRCVDTVDCAATQPTARPNKLGDFIYSPDLGEFTFDDPFAEVNAYNNITSFANWMDREFGWARQFGDHSWIQVKIGISWYNAAYYNGSSSADPFIIFGQDVIDMAYDADVACHEYGHAVNRSLREHPWFLRDAYGLDTSPQGIEEGLADIWTQTFNGDPVMDAYIEKSRTADNDLVCPGSIAGEGHYEARILSGFGWDVRERIGGEAWGHVVYRTLPFLPWDAVFADFVSALATSAADLAEEGAAFIDAGAADVILEEGAARGLLDEACARRLSPMENGVIRSVYGFGRAKTGKRDRPFGLQWVLTAGAGDAAFHLEIDWAYPEDATPGYRVHVSRGRPVGVTWLDPETVAEGEPEFEVDADLTIEGAPPCVDFPEVGRARLEAGEQVYILLSADTDEPTVLLSGTPIFLSEQPPGGDAGPSAEGEIDAHAGPFGMGCAAAPAGDRAVGVLAALLR